MQIRRAQEADIPGINELLRQVLEVHASGRPDLFKHGGVKFTNDELREMIHEGTMLIFVATSDDAAPGEVLAHAFCEAREQLNSNSRTDIRTLYLHDLCVHESARGRHVGSRMLDYLCAYAKDQGFYNLELNVWACNEAALGFYRSRGLVPQKIGMELVLSQ